MAKSMAEYEREIENELREAGIVITQELVLMNSSIMMKGTQTRGTNEEREVTASGDNRANALRALQAKFKSI